MEDNVDDEPVEIEIGFAWTSVNEDNIDNDLVEIVIRIESKTKYQIGF